MDTQNNSQAGEQEHSRGRGRTQGEHGHPKPKPSASFVLAGPLGQQGSPGFSATQPRVAVWSLDKGDHPLGLDGHLALPALVTVSGWSLEAFPRGAGSSRQPRDGWHALVTHGRMYGQLLSWFIEWNPVPDKFCSSQQGLSFVNQVKPQNADVTSSRVEATGRGSSSD